MWQNLRPRVKVSLAKETAIYGVGEVVTKFITIITLIVYTRLFSSEQYGFWTYSLVIADLIAGICNILFFGATCAYTYFYQQANTDEAKKSITSTALVIMLGWGGLISAFALLFQPLITPLLYPNEPSVRWLWAILTLFGLTKTLHFFLGQILRNHYMSLKFISWEIAYSILQVVFTTAGFFLVSSSILGAALGTAFATLLMVVLRLFSILPLLSRHISTHKIQPLLSYGLPFLPTFLAYWAYSYSDRLILGSMSSFQNAGVYSLATSFALPLSFAYTAIGLAVLPRIIQAYQSSAQHLKNIVQKLYEYIFFVGGSLLIWIILFTRDVLAYLFAPDYHATQTIILPITLSYIAFLTTLVTSLGSTLNNKTINFPVFMAISALTKIALSLAWVRSFDIVGVAWATCIASFLHSLLHAIATYRMKLFYTWQSRSALIGVAIVISALLLGHFNLNSNIANIGIKIFISIIGTLMLLWLGFADAIRSRLFRQYL